jgi:hypothetical protein
MMARGDHAQGDEAQDNADDSATEDMESAEREISVVVGTGNVCEVQLHAQDAARPCESPAFASEQHFLQQKLASRRQECGAVWTDLKSDAAGGQPQVLGVGTDMYEAQPQQQQHQQQQQQYLHQVGLGDLACATIPHSHPETRTVVRTHAHARAHEAWTV